MARLLRMDSAITADRNALGRKIGPFWYIENLCVSPAVQSRGVGSQGLQELQSQVRDQSRRKMRAAVCGIHLLVA